MTTTGPSSMRRCSADSWATGEDGDGDVLSGSRSERWLTAAVLRGQAEVVLDGTFGEGAGLILLDDVHCEGSETSLLDCPHGIWGRTDCSHSEDVAVRCRSGQETNEVPAIAPATGERRTGATPPLPLRSHTQAPLAPPAGGGCFCLSSNRKLHIFHPQNEKGSKVRVLLGGSPSLQVNGVWKRSLNVPCC